MSSTRSVCLLLLALVALFVAVPSAEAIEVSADLPTTTPLIGENVAEERDPEIACGTSSCLAVWTSVATGGRVSVLAARVGDNGALRDVPAKLIAAAARNPVVTWTGSSYLVAWEDGPTSNLIRAALVAEDGTVGAVIDVASATSGLSEVAAASLGGTTLLAWRARSPSGGDSDIRGGRVAADGTVLDPAGISIGSGANSQLEPAVAAGDGQFLVAWTDARNGNRDIYGARVTAAGAALDEGGTPISRASGEQSGPSIASDGTAFMVGWTDTRSGDADVYAARVSGDAAVLDPLGLAVSANLGRETAGSVAFDGTSYLLVADREMNSGASGSVLLAAMDPAEPTPAAKSSVVENAGAGATMPRVTRRGTGSVVAWVDHTGGSVELDLKRLDAARTSLDPAPIRVSTGVDYQERPAASFDGANYLVVWFDRRDTGTTGNLRATRMKPDGTVLDPTGILIASGVELPSASLADPPVVSAWNGTHHLVVWQSAGDIWMRRVNPTGTAADAQPKAVSGGQSVDSQPVVAASGSAGWFVAWTAVTAGIPSEVLGARISAAGAVVSNLAIGSSPYVSHTDPAVAFANGSYYVLYYLATGPLRLRVVPANGDPISDLREIVTSAGPATIATDGEGLLVSWVSQGQAFGRRVNFSGVPVGSATSLALPAEGRPDLIFTGGGWVVHTRRGSDSDIRHLAKDLSRHSLHTYSGITKPVLAPGPDATVAMAHARWTDQPPIPGAQRAFLRTIRRFAVRPSAITPSVTEGAPLQFKVTLTPARTDATVTVEYKALTNTATAGQDFEAVTGTLSFAPGVTSQLVEVPTFDDSTDEEDTEWVTLSLTGATGADLDSGGGITSATALITDNDPSPVVTVPDVTVDEDAGVATVNLTLSGPGERSGRVALTRWGGTATPDDDYTFAQTSTIVTFSPGQTHRSVDIPIVDDAIDEPDEYFDLRVAGAQGLTVTDEFTRVTIVDDEPLPGLSIEPAAIAEGNSASVPVPVTLRLSHKSSQTVTATISTTAGSATATSDYGPLSGVTVSFSPGQTVKTISVDVVGDTLDEVDETFSIVASNPQNATLSAASADVTIRDDDGVGLTIQDASVSEDSGTLHFPIVLSRAIDQDASGECVTADGTAKAGTDYTSRSATFTIPAGSTSTTFPVVVAGDLLDEPNETIALNCSGTVSVDWAKRSATGTVLDDDDPPVISLMEPAPVREGDEGITNAGVKVRLSAPSAQGVSAQWRAVSDTALDGHDFGVPWNSGTYDVVFIPPGETEQVLPVWIHGDLWDEASEEFAVSLGLTHNATAGRSSVKVGILDDDGPGVSVGDASVTEGSGATVELAFPITLSSTSVEDVTGTCATSDVGAAAGADYVARTAGFVIPAGSASGSFTVSVVGDLADEADETLTLTCTTASGGDMTDGVASGTIADDDALPVISLADPADVPEGDSGTTEAKVPVRLSVASGRTVTVRLDTADGTAKAPADYAAASGVLVTLAPGDTEKLVPISVIADNVDEPDETVSLALSDPSNATLGAAAAELTILDDDQPALSVSDAATGEPGAGVASLVFPIALDSAVTSEVTGTCATSDATATAGSDYTSRSAGFTIPAGQTGTGFAVEVRGDDLDEIAETLTLTCTAGPGAEVGDGVATGTIVDDDPAPSLTLVDPPDVLEGDSGTQAVQIAVRLSAPSGRAVTARLGTSDQTATAPADYQARSGVELTFLPGETEKLVSVEVAADVVDEPHEAFSIALSDVVGADVATGALTVGILDDDGPAVTVGDARATEGNAGVVALTFTVGLAAPSPQDVTGTCSTADGSATAGVDYLARSASFVVPAGSTAGSFRVDVLGDTADEADETLTLACTVDESGALADGEATGIIVDDDVTVAVPRVGALDATVVEGLTAQVKIELSAPSLQVVTVRARTVDASATSPADFAAVDEVVTFSPGETVRMVAVTTAADSVVEDQESLQVTLSEPAGATVARHAIVTLADGAGRGGAGTGGAGTGGTTGEPPAAVVIGAGRLRADKRGRVPVTLTCPLPGTDPCAGTLTLTSEKKVRVRGRRRLVTFGRVTFTVPRDEDAKVIVRLARANLALLRRLRRISVVAVAGESRRVLQLRAR